MCYVQNLTFIEDMQNDDKTMTCKWFSAGLLVAFLNRIVIPFLLK